MNDDLLPVDFEPNQDSIIKVIGVGGGGSNAVNHMLREGITGVDFVICNTDSQALENSPVPWKIQLGQSLTQGRGAGNKPERGRESAVESMDEIKEILDTNTKMVFITAGMGGGTGTGAAPIIAEVARELDILTVGIVTIPFRFEGRRRIQQAMNGIIELGSHTDALLVINNEKLRMMFGDLKLSDAFSKADDVLSVAVKSIAEIITVHGYVNVDFADVETVVRNSGVAVMGSAMASGENRAMRAIEQALNSPLLNSSDIGGATNILLNIISGEEEVTMQEVGQITEFVQEVVNNDVNIIWGNGDDERLTDEVSVTIIATGFCESPIPDIPFQLKSKSARKIEKAPKLELIIENQAEVEQIAAQRKREQELKRAEMLRKKESKESQLQSNQSNGTTVDHKETPDNYSAVPKETPAHTQSVAKENQQEVNAQVDDEKLEHTNKRNGIDSWFKDKFTRIFDNEDTSM